MDMKPVITIPGPEGTLDVTRCTDSDADGSVVMEGILKEIVIVPDCRDTTNIKNNILSRRNISSRQMALNGISGVMLEKTQAVGVDVGDLTDVE